MLHKTLMAITISGLIYLIVLNTVIFCKEELPKVLLSNSAPGIIGIPVIFTAKLIDVSMKNSYIYKYFWADNTWPRNSDSGQFDESNIATWNITYTVPHYVTKYYKMNVKVYRHRYIFPDVFLTENETSYYVSEWISCNILKYQKQSEAKNNYIATDTSLELTANFHDPNNYIQNKSFVYYFWTINDEESFGPFFESNLTLVNLTTKVYNIRVDINAYFLQNYSFEHNKILQGFSVLQLEAKDPITSYNITGNNYLKDGDLLELIISCSGSPKWSYCFNIYPGVVNVTGNETCDLPRIVDICKFPVIHYFSTVASYTIVTVIKNDVSHKVFPIIVNIYDVDRKPQLSIVLVPVVCTVLAVILIIIGLGCYIKNQKRLTIEEADFDFGRADSEPLTFWHRLNSEIKKKVNQRKSFSLFRN